MVSRSADVRVRWVRAAAAAPAATPPGDAGTPPAPCCCCAETSSVCRYSSRVRFTARDCGGGRGRGAGVFAAGCRAGPPRYLRRRWILAQPAAPVQTHLRGHIHAVVHGLGLPLLLRCVSRGGRAAAVGGGGRRRRRLGGLRQADGAGGGPSPPRNARACGAGCDYWGRAGGPRGARGGRGVRPVGAERRRASPKAQRAGSGCQGIAHRRGRLPQSPRNAGAPGVASAASPPPPARLTAAGDCAGLLACARACEWGVPEAQASAERG